LYHAIQNDDNGNRKPEMLSIYDETKRSLERVEDVILNRRDDATERLLILLKIKEMQK
jgi:5-methyltetrahydrofolate--homocysteine methyltransferase